MTDLETTIIFWSAFVLALTKIMTILIARGFCAKPIPQEFRLYQEFAITLLALRVAADLGLNMDLDPLRILVWLNFAGVGVVVLGANAYRAFWKRDRCPARTG